MADVTRLGTADPCGARCPCGCGYVCALDEGHRERAHQAMMAHQRGHTAPLMGVPIPGLEGSAAWAPGVEWRAQMIHVWRYDVKPKGGGERVGVGGPVKAAG